jgi:hypothetical protein
MRMKSAEEAKFLGRLSNSSLAVRLCSEDGATGSPEDRYTNKGEIMPQYLVAIHHPDNYDLSTEGEAIPLRSQSEFTG